MKTKLKLSDREVQVLGCLTRGDSDNQISKQIGMSRSVVRRTMKALLPKIGAHNRTQAAVWAWQHNIEPPVVEFKHLNNVKRT